ncbi:MAG TPA: glycoside hydrolase family 2 TIM barrel-domain containing protein [Flavitalea sp.]|nr:glycoside hydrolase family 2 TIM barrel-domain containing protein [Flavitalea sp.]
MVKSFCSCIALLFVLTLNAQSWKPVSSRIRTEWADSIDPAKPLPEYPRPQFERKNNWINLNGLWNYSISSLQANSMTASEGNILVPFAVESALSGVGRTVGKDSLLWYSKTITIPKTFRNKTVLIHFGAVDWQCEVFVNGKSAGKHEGGYDPFTFDITSLLSKSGTNHLVIRVWDPTDQGPQPRGKQVSKPEGIWYTAVTGIWQTVWMEAVSSTYITNVKQLPDVDQSTLTITADVAGLQPGDELKVLAFDHGNQVGETTLKTGSSSNISITNPHLWSPEDPFLYQLKYSVTRKGKLIDEATSYFAMRKISLKRDANGIQRIQLNDINIFQYGPLDQGWWPDGLYTAPTDAALKYDIAQTRAMGFNMIRKHVKVEPARWYYYCDLLGMLVWQDMPSGEDTDANRWEPRPFIVGLGTDIQRTDASEKIYRSEWERIMSALYNFPSIVTWIPFNEGWGQFKTAEITEWTMRQDPSRLVDAASGGNYVMNGHIIDLHNYPEPAMPDPAIFGKTQAIVLGEFGGLGLPVKDHLWQDKNWGYQSFGTADSLFRRYAGFADRLLTLIPKGLTAAIYTQTTDVEGEINGLMTYDRKIFKMPIGDLKRVNEAVIKAGK